MPLLNYTTSVPAEKTVGEIQRRLAAHGASRVVLSYGPARIPEAIAFVIPTAWGDQEYRLPANLAGVHKALLSQWKAGKVPKSKATPEQAARVGWRIIKDWLEAQLAVVQAGVFDLAEVMLPYQLGDSGRTVYQAMRDHRLGLPRPGGD